MTKRSTAALARRLRAAEDAHVASLRRDLEDLVRSIDETARTLQSPSLVAELALAGLSAMVTRSFAQGVLLLREFTVETGVSVHRDVRAVEANAGVDLAGVLADWEPFGWEAGAIAWWEDYVTGASLQTGVEIKRQLTMSRLYDDNMVEGFFARMFSFVPLRRQGRRGVGVFPSLVSVLVNGITTPAWSMVNQQKNAAYQSILETANG